MSFDRDANLDRLADEEFDVVVIGGGITGAGCALDAASRGMRTALVERGDWASGTSSKSSKMVHGGLRYLQQREIRLVYEALRERQRLLKNAPHLVRIMPHLIPIFGKDGLIDKRLARAFGSALWLYDLTGGWRIGKRHKRLDREAALAFAPTLRDDLLAAAYLYYDALADDARLTLTLARTAALDHNAAVANRATVVGLEHNDAGEVRSVTVRADGRDIAVRTSSVVSATGVWADDITELDTGGHPSTIRPAKGIHVTVPTEKVRATIAVSGLGTSDKRSMFVVPWGDLTYLGTTDTDYEGTLDDPQCTPDDVDYLLRGFNRWFREPLTKDDVVGTWAGLRPLVKSAASERTADLSRRHAVNRAKSGVVTITGGKLTTYREMASDAINEVVETFDAPPRAWQRSRTAKLRLRGAATGDHAEHLYSRYGSEASAVMAVVAESPEFGERLVPELPYLKAEAIYAVRYEMATTLDDIFSRRTRARLMLRDATAAAAPDVAALIAPELGWSAGDQVAEVDAYRVSVAQERGSPELPITS